MLSADPTAIDQNRPLPAERHLWTAVLRQAVCDLLGIDTGAHRSYRMTLQYFARLWFESTNPEPGSFEWICDQLELDASWLRRRLLEMAGRNSAISLNTCLVEGEPEEGGDTGHDDQRLTHQTPQPITNGRMATAVNA